MTAVTFSFDSERPYPTPPESEKGALARGWTPSYFVTAVYPGNRLSEDFTDVEAALSYAAGHEAAGAETVSFVEVSAYDREQSAAERGYEARYG